MINNPSSTSVQRTFPRTLLSCTIRNNSNQLNRQINSSLSQKSANAWNVVFLQDSECTHVRCLGHFSDFRAFVPS